MKKRLLTTVALCLAGIGAFAQWTAPELPTTTTQTLELGRMYQIKNADSDQFIGSGTGYNLWSTAVTMVNRDDAITYIIDDTTDTFGSGISFVNNASGYFTFISDDGTNENHPGWGEMHVDMTAGQGYNHFEVYENGDGTFLIYTPEYPNSSDADAPYSGYWGWVKNETTYPQAVWAMLDKDDPENSCRWELYDMTVYQVRYELYEALVESLDYPDIDQSIITEATQVYNNESSTLEELEAARDSVREAINSSVTQGGSPDNPVDATSLITNNDFSTGNISGWNCTFVSGQNATNVGYQTGGNGYYNTAYTYINHEGEEVNPFCYQFIEAWSQSGAAYGSQEVTRSIGDAELSQTAVLPAGNYTLSCDVIAVQQSSSYQDHNPVKGTQLYVATDSWETYIEVSSADETPEHYSLTFASDGSSLTFGLRTRTTDANWIAADNFELMYYGNDGTSPYYITLKNAVDEAEETYPDLSEVFADQEVKTAYEEALAAAKAMLDNATATDDEYQATLNNFTAAREALDTSVSNYASVQSTIDYIYSIIAQAEEYKWTELIDELQEMVDMLNNGYYAGTLTDELIESVEENVQKAIADYISKHVEAGQDISMVITNPDFDTDFSGWTVTGTTPTFGGNGTAFGGGTNSISGGIQPADIGSGDAEVYHATFDISQVVKSLPQGLYTLSCSGFCRDDNGDGRQGILYAVVNGEEQTQTLMDLYEEGSPTQLYEDSNGTYSDSQATLNNGDAAWVPWGMAGANIYFTSGYYHNEFNIFVEDRADLTIGVRETNTDDWVIFDNFRLVYQGNDAGVYTDLIQQLIDEASALLDSSSPMTIEAEQNIMNAIDYGYDALELTPPDADVSLAAVMGLREAIAAGEASIALIQELIDFTDYTNDVRVVEVENSSIIEELFEIIEEVFDALDDDVFETDAEVQGYLDALMAIYNKCAIYDYLDVATEDNPADVTPCIITHDCVDLDGEGSTFGWNINSGTSLGLDYNCIEIYNQEAGAGLSQDVFNLYAGWYRLGVQAFYRPFTQASSVDISAVEEADTIHNVNLFAGDKATRVISIYADAEAYSDIEGLTTETTYGVPNTMEEAEYAFDDDLYHNILQFQVAEDGTDVTIGLVKTGYVTNDWLIWTNWTLDFIGMSTPTSDPTTVIESVEGTGDVVATAIYTVNGVQQSSLTKGVNIVKQTLSDGTVKVTKVLKK